jgi:amino acid transporter
MLLAGIGFPLVWGMLAGSMPRSGGEYIYNSRIVHPIVGIAENFGNAFVMIFWIYVLAPWVADPGLVLVAQYMDWTWLYNNDTGQFFGNVGYTTGVFIVASVANLGGFLATAFGLKYLVPIQRVTMAIGIGGAIVMCIALTSVSKETFIASWNEFAATYGSLDYNAFIVATGEAAGETMPETWNWYDTIAAIGAASWLFAYAYFLVYVAGEVKRPDRNLLAANFIAVLIPVVFMSWTMLAAYRIMDFEFLSATAWVDNNYELEGYTLPFLPNIMSLAYIARPNAFVGLAVSLSFMAFCFWWVALSYLGFPRMLFAWGMDRLGPKWFTDINPRFASPVKTAVLCFVLAEVAIAIYVFWIGDIMQGLTVTGMEIVSVWLITALAALIFPWRRRSKGIWESSPYRTWSFLGVPVISWGAVLMLIYSAICFYFLVLAPEMRDFTWSSLILYSAVWGTGIVWYFVYRWWNGRQGIDISMAYGQLPPE